MTKQITQFERLDKSELKTAIREVLEGVAYVDRSRDERVDVEPYVGLIDLYKPALSDLKDRMASVFKVLIESELETLSDSGKHNLFRVLQDCGDRLVDTIETIARRQTLVAKSKELHALVLKCLISLNCRQSSEFWLKQLDALGPEYGAVILSGLLQHGIETGFKQLPQLTQSDAAARRIAMALPSIADQFGEDEVKRQVAKTLPHCTSQAQKLMQVVFPVSELETGDVLVSKRRLNIEVAEMISLIDKIVRETKANLPVDDLAEHLNELGKQMTEFIQQEK